MNWDYKGYLIDISKKYHGDQKDWNQGLKSIFNKIVDNELFSVPIKFKELFLSINGFILTSYNVGILNNKHSIFFNDDLDDNQIIGDNGSIIIINNF